MLSDHVDEVRRVPEQELEVAIDDRIQVGPQNFPYFLPGREGRFINLEEVEPHLVGGRNFHEALSYVALGAK